MVEREECGLSIKHRNRNLDNHNVFYEELINPSKPVMESSTDFKERNRDTR